MQPFLTSFTVREENMLWAWPEKICESSLRVFSLIGARSTVPSPVTFRPLLSEAGTHLEGPLWFVWRLEPGGAEGETRATAQKGEEVWPGGAGGTSCPVTPTEVQPSHSLSRPPCSHSEGGIWTLSRVDRKGGQLSLNKSGNEESMNKPSLLHTILYCIFSST